MIRLSGSVKLSCADSFGSPHSRLHGRPPFGFRSRPGFRPRASSASRARASSRPFAARIADSRSFRRRSPSGCPSPRTDSPSRSSSAASVSCARATSASIPSCRRRSSCAIRPWLVALRLLAFARTFVPSTDSVPNCATPDSRARPATSANRRLKSERRRRPKLAHRPVTRRVPRRQSPERHVLLQLPRDLPRRERPRRVPAHQNLRHHRRVARTPAPAVAPARRVERTQIQRVHQVAHVVRQMTLRKPVARIRRQKHRLTRRARTAGRSRQPHSHNSKHHCPIAPATPPGQFLRRRLLARSTSALAVASQLLAYGFACAHHSG